MPPRVFTDAQLALLKELLPEFAELQKNGSSLAEFWEKALHEYFEENPGPESDYQAPVPVPKLTKKGKESKRQLTARPPARPKVFESLAQWKLDRQTKIRDWFNNATSKGRQNRKPVVKIVVSAMSEKRDRILSEEQLYSKMYYETRIKMHVDKKMEEGDGGESRLKVMNEIVKAMWKGEDKETKAEVRAERARLVAEKKQKEEELEEVLDKDEDAKLKPEEYATFQEALPSIIDSFLDIVHKKSGLALTVLVGGPHPALVNGAVKAYTFNIGEGSTTFFGAFPEAKQAVSPMFSKYCHQVFPEAVRLRRAISIDETKIIDQSALRASRRFPGHLRFDDRPLEKGEEDVGGETPEAMRDGFGGESEKYESSGAERDESSGAERNESGGAERDASGGAERDESGESSKGASKKRGRDGDEPDDGSDPHGDRKAKAKKASAPKPRARKRRGGMAQEGTENNGGENKGKTTVDTKQPSVQGQMEDDEETIAPLMLDPEHHSGFHEQYGAPLMFEQPMMDFDMISGPNTTSDGAMMQHHQMPIVPGWIPTAGITNGNGMLDLLHRPLSEADLMLLQTNWDTHAGLNVMGANAGGAESGLQTNWDTHAGLNVVGANAGGAESGGSANLGGPNGGAAATSGNEGIPDPTSDGDDVGMGGNGVNMGLDAHLDGGKGGVATDIEEAPKTDGPRKSGRGVKRNVELPDWLAGAHSYLLEANSEEAWVRAIEDWMKFEKNIVARGGAGNGRLGAAFRPAELTKWLLNRTFGSIPAISDVSVFASSWEKWWNGVRKPEKKGGAGTVDGGLGDLSGIRKGGPSGVHIALIGLAWWGKEAGLSERWKDAVKDVAECMGHIGAGRA